MTVFKGYLRIVRANLGQLLMYVGIFLAICVAISRSNPGGTTESFTQKKLNAAVIDRDGGSLALCLSITSGRSTTGFRLRTIRRYCRRSCIIGMWSTYWLFQKVRRNGCSPGRRMALYSV